MEQMDIDNYAQRIERLEDDELELKTSAENYVELFSLYLYQNQLIEAKNLIQRIPTEIKKENKEIAQLELLLNALNTNNTAEFFKNINFSWSDNTKDIMQQLKEKTMEDLFNLVSHAYTSILEQNLSQMTQLSGDELKNACQSLGWSFAEHNQKVIILPIPNTNTSSTFGNSKQQMFKLTEFVTFLEN